MPKEPHSSDIDTEYYIEAIESSSLVDYLGIVAEILKDDSVYIVLIDITMNIIFVSNKCGMTSLQIRLDT